MKSSIPESEYLGIMLKLSPEDRAKILEDRSLMVQQLAEAREKLAECNGWRIAHKDEIARLRTELAESIEELAAVTDQRDRMAAEGMRLREAVEILDWGQWADGDGDFCQECGEFKSKGHAPGCRIFKALANSAATTAEAERVRRLERFVETAREAASGHVWCQAALAALDAAKTQGET